MFGFKFIKVDPSTYLIKVRNGRIAKEGAGISVFYHVPTTSLIRIPMGSEDVFFMFSELTQDYQEVTVQGQATYKIMNVHALTKMLNYTLNARSEYLSDDPKKLSKRVINLIQIVIRKELSKLNLKEAISFSENIAITLKTQLGSSAVLAELGIQLIEISITAIKPNQETARALEAQSREILLGHADEAMYQRRNAAIEQERTIKENELKTEIAVEDKKREIAERRLEGERSIQKKRQEMRESEISGEVIIQKKNEELVFITSENAKKEADVKAYALNASLEVVRKTDVQVIRALAMNGMKPAQLIASSFHELAEKANVIGQLNINPDLLKQLMQNDNA